MIASVRRLGVHTSIAGGIDLSLDRAQALGCNTMQIFSHNPRRWIIDKISEEEVGSFKALRGLYMVNPVFIHASYLINLASVNSNILEKSIHLLIGEMELADLLSADYVVLHTGSASQDTKEKALRRASNALKTVSQAKTWRSQLLLENAAAKRGDISSRIIDLCEIINAVDSPLIGGVCLDTCHAFAAGYDLSKGKGLLNIVAELKKFIGLSSVKLIHLNDSKREFNSHVDRHEHIGKGSIGKLALKRLIRHPALRDIPIVLETPKKSRDDDERNLMVVRDLL